MMITKSSSSSFSSQEQSLHKKRHHHDAKASLQTTKATLNQKPRLKMQFTNLLLLMNSHHHHHTTYVHAIKVVIKISPKNQDGWELT
jgi:hypothetical protein